VSETRITKEQRKVLRSISVEGAGNIREIQRRTESKYPSTHRSVKKLNELGLIWLSKIEDIGPKSAQTYSITALGILASIIYCETSQNIPAIIDHWSEITPRFINCWNRYSQYFVETELIHIIHRTYSDIQSLTLRHPNIETNSRALIISKNSIDTNILDNFYRTFSSIRMGDVIKIIKSYPGYQSVLDHWIGILHFKLDYLNSLNEQ
jgi:hypothetical protein